MQLSGPIPKDSVCLRCGNELASQAPRWADATSLTSDQTLNSTVLRQIKITESFGCILMVLERTMSVVEVLYKPSMKSMGQIILLDPLPLGWTQTPHLGRRGS